VERLPGKTQSQARQVVNKDITNTIQIQYKYLLAQTQLQ
jgi:hypothetical protein